MQGKKESERPNIGMRNNKKNLARKMTKRFDGASIEKILH